MKGLRSQSDQFNIGIVLLLLGSPQSQRVTEAAGHAPERAAFLSFHPLGLERDNEKETKGAPTCSQSWLTTSAS